MKVLKATQILQLGGQGQTAMKAEFPTIMNKVIVIKQPPFRTKHNWKEIKHHEIHHPKSATNSSQDYTTY